MTQLFSITIMVVVKNEYGNYNKVVERKYL